MGAFNLYEILGVSYDASIDEIKAAYREKMIKSSPTMSERLKTAYYVLTDDDRRRRYDYQIGLRKYKQVKTYKKLMKGISRIFLTFLDVLFTFYKSFLIALCLVLGWLAYEEDGYLSLKTYQSMCMNYKMEMIVLFTIAVVCIPLHRYVRRLNRYLKHKTWEVR